MAFINRRRFLFTCYVLFLGYCPSYTLSRLLEGNNHTALSTRAKHEQWMATYGRTYKDLAEKEKRFNIFKENVEHIESINSASSSNHRLYTLGVNAFTDVTKEEFIATYTGSKPLSPLQSLGRGSISTNFKYKNITNVPPSIDWREKGAVTPIKEQGRCGCCWAFAVAATIEGLNQINTGNLISLSEQQLIDCDKTNHGCKGGNMKKAFRFIYGNKGIVTEQVYPYKATQGECHQTLQGERVTIAGFETVPTRNEDALIQAVSKQPVAVRIDSSGIRYYKGGIYNGECGTNLDHDVTIIGYGTENGNDYWLIKNSWGLHWGEKGFMRIIRGLNMCGLAIAPSYPI